MKIHNQALKKQLEDIGFDISVKGKTVILKSRQSACQKLMGKKSFTFKSGFNEAMLKGLRSESVPGSGDSYSDFSGGSFDQLKELLCGKVDLEPYQRVKKKLEGKGILKLIKTDTKDLIPKRSRRLSEHDGEWDYSRRFEIQPFMATIKTMTEAKTLEIVANIATAGCSSAESINHYAALVWSLSMLIESLGIQTKITYLHQATGISDDREAVNERFEMTLKEAGEYVSPNLIAASFHSNFYRRVVFSLETICADLAHEKISLGMGQAYQAPGPIEFRDGKLIVSPLITKADDQTVRDAVLEAVKGKRK